MTPQWHDEFVALCALFPSGELTEEEWALLQVHLAYCDSCRLAFPQYQHLANDVMPAVAASVYLDLEDKPDASSFSLEAAGKRLMSRLESVPTNQAPRHRPFIRQIAGAAIAASVVGLACLLGWHFNRSRSASEPQPATVAKIESPSGPVAPTGIANELQPALESAQHEVGKLQQQLSAAEERSRQSNSVAATMEQQLKTEQIERKKISDEKDGLSRQLLAAQTEAQSWREKSTGANTVATQQATRMIALESKLREVNATLGEKDRMLALDKEFLAHDREIRDLIGARDLYIADIYDVAQNGKTAKPFGRIFYTKDRSLVFYGYDLDKQTGLKQSVAFQAWGSGDDKQNVSLGLFYQDDTHKRWVLRFNDTKTLARLNMVFVTAEPQGGSTKPTGKPLLLAYLQMQPNHP